MSKKTSIELGIYSYFVREQIQEGNYTDESEVVKAGLKLLEEKKKIYRFRKAMKDGIDSGISNDFDSKKYLEYSKAKITVISKFEITNKAVDDLNNIWDRVNTKKTKRHADEYFNSLIFCSRKIAENPDSGTEYNEISKDVLGEKMYKVPGMSRFNYKIFYRILDVNYIEIVRILSEHMDIKNYLQQSTVLKNK